MNTDPAFDVLRGLGAARLRELGVALSTGILRHGFSSQSLAPFAGPGAAPLDHALKSLLATGFDHATLGILCQGMSTALAEKESHERNTQLILSGPGLPGVPVMDTRTTVQSLFREAQSEVLITSYVFHQAKEFFRELAVKHDAEPGFQVTFVVDISHRKAPANYPPSLVAAEFVKEFRQKHWPGKRLPEIWYDPRYANPDESGGGVMHSKAVVIDRKCALVTSANFTGAAHSHNIETGLLLRHSFIARRLHDYFAGLIRTGVLRQAEPA